MSIGKVARGSEGLHHLERLRRQPCAAERSERPAAAEFGGEERVPFGFRQTEIVGGDAGRGEEIVDGARVPAGVVAQIEPDEVKAEDFDLPDDVVQIALRDRFAASLAQRPLDQPQIGEELGGTIVAAGLALARRPHAFPHQRDGLPIRFAGVAVGQHRAQFGKAFAIVRQQRMEQRSGTDDAFRQREAARQIDQPSIPEGERGVAHHLQRFRRHRRRHVRVAVAIAADPRPEGQKRRHDDRRVRIDGGDRRFQIAIDPWHDVDERCGDIDEIGPHLVQHGRRHRPDFVRAPQFGDRAGEAAAGIGGFARQRRPLVEIAQDREDARQLGDDRPTTGFGGVGRQHGPHQRPIEHRLQAGGIEARRREPRGRFADGAAAPAGFVRFASPNAPDAFAVFGQVDQLKIEREGADERIGFAGAERIDQIGQRFARPAFAGAKRLGERSRPLFALERGFAGLRARRIAEQPGEQIDIVGQGAGRRHLGRSLRRVRASSADKRSRSTAAPSWAAGTKSRLPCSGAAHRLTPASERMWKGSTWKRERAAITRR